MSIERSTSKTARLVQSFITVIMSILGLQRFILCWCWLARHLAKDCSICHWSSLWVVCRGRCLIRHHNYRTPPSLCLSTACHQSPSARPAHLTDVQALDSATMRRHSGGPGEGVLIIFVSELLEIAVWIIENEKKQFLFSQKIISELLERLNYWSQYGSHYFQFSTFYCLLRLSFGDY